MEAFIHSMGPVGGILKGIGTKNHDYEQAIRLYTQALPQTLGVDLDLRIKAEIAVQNRISTCYRSVG